MDEWLDIQGFTNFEIAYVGMKCDVVNSWQKSHF